MKKLLSVLLALTLSSAVLVACGSEAEDTTPDVTTTAPTTTTKAPDTTTDPNTPDTNEPDTNAPDTNEPDTNAPDTNAPDTNEPDTNAPDTNAPDTNEPDVDVTGATNINEIAGVDARIYAFEYPSEFGGSTVALIYYFYDANGAHNQMASTIADGGYAVVYIDGAAFKIENYANNAPWFRFDVETPGATLISGLNYEIAVYVYDAEDTLLYYTNVATKVADLSTANAPERESLKVDLPEGLTDVAVQSDSIAAEGLTAWGDGAPANLFDSNTTASKIGGTTSGTVTVSFSLEAAATVTYYTLYTGGDTATNGARNPSAWTLYGEVNGEWVELSAVANTKTTVTGLEATNSTPYSYKVTAPAECANYKIVFTTGGMFQLNEMVLHVG